MRAICIICHHLYRIIFHFAKLLMSSPFLSREFQCGRALYITFAQYNPFSTIVGVALVAIKADLAVFVIIGAFI